MNDSSSKDKTFSLQYVTALTDEMYKMRKEHAAEIDEIDREYAAEINEMRKVHAAEIVQTHKKHAAEIENLNKALAGALARENDRIQKMQKAHAEELNRPIEDRVNETLNTYYEWYICELDGFKKEAEAYEAEFKNLKFIRAAIIGATMAIIIAAIAFCSESLIEYLPLMTIMAVPTLIFSYFCNKSEGKKIKSRRRA